LLVPPVGALDHPLDALDVFENQKIPRLALVAGNDLAFRTERFDFVLDAVENVFDAVERAGNVRKIARLPDDFAGGERFDLLDFRDEFIADARNFDDRRRARFERREARRDRLRQIALDRAFKRARAEFGMITFVDDFLNRGRFELQSAAAPREAVAREDFLQLNARDALDVFAA
jgi:hypothetical protein